MCSADTGGGTLRISAIQRHAHVRLLQVIQVDYLLDRTFTSLLCIQSWVGLHSPGCRDLWWLGREGPGDILLYQQDVGSIGSASHETRVKQDMYGRLSLILVRENA